MPLFYRSQDEKEARARLANAKDSLKTAKIRFKAAKTEFRTVKTVEKEKRTFEKARRLEAHPHSSGHHGGKCDAACRAGRSTHGHRR